jgi:hypothetical protein
MINWDRDGDIDDDGDEEDGMMVMMMMMMMMCFICSCRNKIGAELHMYIEEGTYHKRLFKVGQGSRYSGRGIVIRR